MRILPPAELILWLILCVILCLPTGRPAGDDESGKGRLERLFPLLLSASRLEREDAALLFRAGLDSSSAEDLVVAMPGLPPALRKTLEELLGAGGPWIPGVAAAARRGGEAAAQAQAILLLALRKRPLADESSSSVGVADLFVDGVTLDFRGAWPGPVPLGELLDRINLLTGPSRPIVLSPELAGPVAPVKEKPCSGPAPMVVDLLLAERGLGLKLLDTVALVVPGENGCFELDRENPEFDALLVKKVVLALSLPEAGGGGVAVRREALRALSWLEIPGFFEGAFRNVRAGDRGDCLAYLLSGGSAGRLADRLAVRKEAETTAVLINAWEAAEAGPRKRTLARVLSRLPGELTCRALTLLPDPSADVRLLFGGDEDDASFARFFGDRFFGVDVGRAALLRAALPRLGRSAAVRDSVLEAIAAARSLDVSTAAIADRCVDSAAAFLDDEKLARLVSRVPPFLPGAIEAAARLGGVECREALIEELCKGTGRDPIALIRALEKIARRQGTSPLAAAAGRMDGMSGLTRAAFLLVFEENVEFRAAAAETIVETMAAGGDDVSLAAGILALAPASRLVGYTESHLRSAADGSGEISPRLWNSFALSALRSIASDRIAADGMRKGLKKVLGSSIDPLLERVLNTLHRIAKVDSFVIDMRFF
jgi:hypothetical protein